MSSARLVILGEDGENPPSEMPPYFMLTKERTTIGRSRSADLTMDSEAYPCTLSRTHVVIWREDIGNGEFQWHVSDSHTMNGTFIGCVKVSDCEINDGEIITLGGGAGLNEGERSDLLASDLVFRFEVIYDDDASAANVTPGNATPLPDSPTSVSSGPPRAPAASVLKVWDDKKKKTNDNDNDNKTLSPSAAPALPTNTKPVGKERSNTLPSGSASIPTTQTTTNEPTNQTNTKNLKGDSGAVALAFNVPRSVARTALNEEKGNEMNAARRVMHESMSAEVKCAVCCDFFYNACTLTCSHSFCESCIEQCLYRKHECPVCRTVVSTRPVRSNHLDNIVQTLMNEDDWLRRQNREAATKKREVAAVTSLQKRLIDNKQATLEITSEWNTNQKTIFESGVNQYRGDARKLYCDTIGLTNLFLENASQNKLLMAAVNVSMIAPENAGGIGAGELRRKLSMFIMYGKM